MYWTHEILHFVQNDKHAIFMIATQSLLVRARFTRALTALTEATMS